MKRLNKYYYFLKSAQDREDSDPEAESVPVRHRQMELFPGMELVNYNCSFEGCENSVTNEDLENEEHKDTEDNVYCVEHVKECQNCPETHPIVDMHEGSDGEFYCEGCFNDLFVTCPACDELVSSDDFYQPSSRNRHGDRKHGGCENCSFECYSCNKVVNKDDEQTAPHDSHSYCDECFWEMYTVCVACDDTVDRDSATYVEGHDGEYCSDCYADNFYTCYECNEPVEKNEAIEFEEEMYCPDCAPAGSGLGVLDIEKDLDKDLFKSFSYSPEDRLLTPLLKLLPISPKELKKVNPRLSAALSDLINFSKGKVLTPELVEAYRATLSPSEEFPIEYSTWKNKLQRSVKSKSPQLILKILASEQLLNRLKSNPVAMDLFSSINNYFSTSIHPSSPTGIGWARVEISPDKEYMLVDEIQMDHMNTIFKIKNNDSRFAEMVRKIKSNHHLSDEEFYKQADQFLNILKDFPNIASIAMERFARQHGIKRIFWHTYESGKKLKGNAPPKSLYTTTPKEHFYSPSEDRPFGLSGEFFSKEAKKAYMLYKLAKLWNKKY